MLNLKHANVLSNAFNVLPLTQSKHFVSVSQCLSAERTCRKGCQIEATIRLGGTRASDPSVAICTNVRRQRSWLLV